MLPSGLSYRFQSSLYTALCVLTAATFFLVSSVWDLRAGPPSSLDQYHLELLNRARANPDAEVARLDQSDWEGSPDLNEGIDPATLSSEPRPPIAFDPRLIDASILRFVSYWPEAYGSVGTPPAPGIGRLPEDILVPLDSIPDSLRMRAVQENFVFPDGATFGENFETLSILRERTGPLDARMQGDVDLLHEALFVDAGTESRERRRRILDSKWTVMGMKSRHTSTRAPLSGLYLREFASVQSFVYNPVFVCLTGVIYHDLNANNFYDVAESAGSLDLEVRTPEGKLIARGRSFGSGGYTIPLHNTAPGSYQLWASDSLGNRTSTDFQWTGSKNVKADIVDPPFIAPIVFDTGAKLALSVGFSDSKQKGGIPGRFIHLSRKVRSRRPLQIHCRLENLGVSKIEIPSFYGFRTGRRGPFRVTNRIATVRGTRLVLRSVKPFGSRLELQSDEIITSITTVLPNRRAGDKGRRNAGFVYILTAKFPQGAVSNVRLIHKIR